jgi:hypothetical protein
VGAVRFSTERVSQSNAEPPFHPSQIDVRLAIRHGSLAARRGSPPTWSPVEGKRVGSSQAAPSVVISSQVLISGQFRRGRSARSDHPTEVAATMWWIQMSFRGGRRSGYADRPGDGVRPVSVVDLPQSRWKMSGNRDGGCADTLVQKLLCQPSVSSVPWRRPYLTLSKDFHCRLLRGQPFGWGWSDGSPASQVALIGMESPETPGTVSLLGRAPSAGWSIRRDQARPAPSTPMGELGRSVLSG